jgi:membrane-associated protein
MNPIDFILHIDKHLEYIVTNYETTTYFILCLIVFCETGLVVTPLLPGDSLLFAAGAIVAKVGVLNIWLLIPLLIISAILGDNVNYFIGNYVGPTVFEKKKIPFLKREYLERTQKFYDEHGGKTIIMARFIPIIRTFAPFVAGVGSMKYSRFIGFSVATSTITISINIIKVEFN